MVGLMRCSEIIGSQNKCALVSIMLIYFLAKYIRSKNTILSLALLSSFKSVLVWVIGLWIVLSSSLLLNTVDRLTFNMTGADVVLLDVSQKINRTPENICMELG